MNNISTITAYVLPRPPYSNKGINNTRERSYEGTETRERSYEGTETRERSYEGTETRERSYEGTETRERLKGQLHNKSRTEAVICQQKAGPGHLMT